MNLANIINSIHSASDELYQAIEARQSIPPLGIRRSARLPWMVALRQSIQHPLLLITDRNDHALMLADELALWAPKLTRLFFPEPNPLFYENAPWGLSTRRDRLAVLTTLANYHIPGGEKHAPPIIIASIRAVMAALCPWKVEMSLRSA